MALTNGTVSGSVTADGAGSFTVGKLVVPDPDDSVGETRTVDGVAKTAAQYLTALTVGDTATYSQSASAEVYTLADAAPAAKTGTAVVAAVALVDTIAAADDTDATITMIVSGAAVVVTIVDANTEVLVDAFDAVDSYKVDGVLTTSADFLAKITPGDSVTFQAADAATLTDSSISLTNVNGIPTAVEATSINTGADTLTIEVGDGNDDSDSISYAAATTSLLGVSTGAGGVVKYQSDGVAVADAAAWEADANAFILAPSITAKVTLTKVGVDLVWNVTSS